MYKFQQVFRHLCGELRAFRSGRFQHLFLFVVLQFDLFLLSPNGAFRFLQIRFRMFHTVLDVFDSHHLFQHQVFQFGRRVLRSRDFVLQRLVGFIRFDGTALAAIFLRALFPLLHIQLEFFSLRQGLCVGFLGRGYGRLRAIQLGIRFAKSFGQAVEFGPKRGDPLIKLLEVHQMGNCGMHAERF